MKKLLLITMCAFLIGCNEKNKTDEKIIATFKGGNVTQTDVNQALRGLKLQHPNLKVETFSALDANVREALIRDIVAGKLLGKEAKKEKLNDDLKELKINMKAIGIPTIEEYESDKQYWRDIAVQHHLDELDRIEADKDL